MSKEEENWINVRGFEGVYLISDLGRVMRIATLLKSGKIKKGKILKNTINNRGYVHVTLSDRRYGLTKKYKMHKLMAINFLGHIPKGQEEVVDHVNEIKTDNRLCNLQLLSHRDNIVKSRQGKGTSKFVGVWFCSRSKIWKAEIRHKNKRNYLGRFKTEEAAAKAYMAKYKILYGKKKK